MEGCSKRSFLLEGSGSTKTSRRVSCCLITRTSIAIACGSLSRLKTVLIDPCSLLIKILFIFGKEKTKKKKNQSSSCSAYRQLIIFPRYWANQLWTRKQTHTHIYKSYEIALAMALNFIIRKCLAFCVLRSTRHVSNRGFFIFI